MKAPAPPPATGNFSSHFPITGEQALGTPRRKEAPPFPKRHSMAGASTSGIGGSRLPVVSPALSTAASTVQAVTSQPRAQARPEAAISKDEFVSGSAKRGPVISDAGAINNPIYQGGGT